MRVELAEQLEPPVHDPYNPTYVLVPHDDGTWYRAELLSQHRIDNVWHVTVAYSTAPGFRFWRGMPADWCRPVITRPEAESVRSGPVRPIVRFEDVRYRPNG